MKKEPMSPVTIVLAALVIAYMLFGVAQFLWLYPWPGLWCGARC